MKKISLTIFYLFNILAAIPLLILCAFLIASLGVSLGASGGGFAIPLLIAICIYLFINYRFSKKFKNSWIHFFSGMLVGPLTLYLIKFVLKKL